MVSATRPYRFGEKAVRKYLVAALKLAIGRRRLRLRRNGYRSRGGDRGRAATSRARLYRNGRSKVAASVHCSPPEPVNSFMHKGLSTRGNPFFFRFGAQLAAKFRPTAPRTAHRLHSQWRRVRASAQVSASMRQSPHFCNAQLSVIWLTDSLVAWKQNYRRGACLAELFWAETLSLTKP